MLSELELKVVRDHKVHDFKSEMSYLWMSYEDHKTTLTEDNLPDDEDIKKFYDIIETYRFEFDETYRNLQEAKVNPLKIEQEAWELLSERIKQYQIDHKEFIENAHSIDNTPENRQKLSDYLDGAFELLKKWEIISKSYAGKYDIAIYRGKPNFEHMTDEKWMEDIPEREQRVEGLIEELSQ
jgi:hypothetical protein